jgi:hypothetical protein
MNVQLVTDHETRAAALLTEQFKGQPAIVAVLKSWSGQVQGLEDSAYETLLQRALDTATGISLDLLGGIVGQPRGGRSDAQYRLWIAGRVLVNKSRGKAPQLIAIAAKLCNGPVRLREYYPAAFTIYCDRVITGSDGVEIAKLLKIAKAAGVRMHFVWYDSPTAFRFSVGGALGISSSRGFNQGRLGAVSDGRDMAFAPEPPPGPGGGDGSGALLVVL